jgi:hypothetical protein
MRSFSCKHTYNSNVHRLRDGRSSTVMLFRRSRSVGCVSLGGGEDVRGGGDIARRPRCSGTSARKYDLYMQRKHISNTTYGVLRIEAQRNLVPPGTKAFTLWLSVLCMRSDHTTPNVFFNMGSKRRCPTVSSAVIALLRRKARPKYKHI